MAKANQLKAGSILSYAQMAIQIIVGVLYTPIMIRLLGQSEYGLYNTVASTISMISILNLGFSSGYIKFYSKYKAKNEQNLIDKLNGLYLIVFSILGIIALFCGLFLTVNLRMVFENGLTKTEYSTARVLMLLLTINLTVSFPMNVFQCIISSQERFIFLKTVAMLKTVVTPLLTIPILLMGYGSIGLVLVSVSLSIIVDSAYIFYTFASLHTRFSFGDFEKGLFIELFKYTSFIAINIITDQINWNIDKFILGRYCGTLIVAIYSVGATIQSYYQMFSLAVSNVFIPRIHRIVNENGMSTSKKNDELTKIFIKVGRIQYIVLALIMSGFVFFGKEFIAIWAGNGYEDSYVVALLLMLPVTIPLIQNIGTEIQRALNKHQLRSIIYLFMAMINLAITIILCQKYGAIGAALGTTISLVLSTGIIMNLLYYYVLHINVVKFWINIGRMSLGLVIPVFIGIIIKKLVNIENPFILCICIFVYTIVYSVSFYFIGMNQFEKNLVSAPIKRLLKIQT